MKKENCTSCGETFERKPKSTNKRCQDCIKAKRLALSKRFYEEHYPKVLSYRYPITAEEATELIRKYPVCGICGNPESRKGRSKLCVDHDHKTGAVRGLLCDNCNKALGCLQDDPDRAEKAAQYLRSFLK